MSPQLRLLVLFQVSTGAMALMGLDLATLQPLWSTKAPTRVSWVRLQLSGPCHNIILTVMWGRLFGHEVTSSGMSLAGATVWGLGVGRFSFSTNLAQWGQMA